jgi:hypothetical protein
MWSYTAIVCITIIISTKVFSVPWNHVQRAALQHVMTAIQNVCVSETANNEKSRLTSAVRHEIVSRQSTHTDPGMWLRLGAKKEKSSYGFPSFFDPTKSIKDLHC